jgi:hypothetical protein
LNQLNPTYLLNCLSLYLTISGPGFYRPPESSGFYKLSAIGARMDLRRPVEKTRGGRVDMRLPALAGLPLG